LLMVDRDPFDELVVPFVPPLPASLPPIDVSGLVPPPILPLAAEDVEHYRWLIDSLLHGVERLVAPCAPPAAVVALDVTRDLFADLVARIVPEEVR
jgi:hypothetical protein